MIQYYCSTCGYECWSTKIEVIICCGHYVEHKELEGAANDQAS